MTPAEIEYLLDMPLAFSGYLPVGGEVADFYPTISHWFESEKFRGVHERTRYEILSMPTSKEARKAAKKLQLKCRLDWQSVRQSVLSAGILMAAEQNQHLAEMLAPLASWTSLELGANVTENPVIHGQAYRSLLGTVHSAAEAMFNEKNVILIASIKRQNYIERKAQIDKQIGRIPIRSVLCPVIKDMAPMGAEYAIANQQPVKYLYSENGRLTEAFIAKLTQNTTQIVVFEKKGGKTFDSLIDQAKRLSIQTKLFLI
jgi:hypothetical protein